MEKFEIVFWNDKRSSKCRAFMKLKTSQDRFRFLTCGGIDSETWFDLKTNKEFYRPKLNGITVANPEKPFAKFRTPESAIKAGLSLMNKIKNQIKTTTS